MATDPIPTDTTSRPRSVELRSASHIVARVIAIGLGLLLLAAAGLKLYGQSVSAVPAVGWFATPWLQMAAAEWEVVLGLWLLSGAARRGAWLAAFATFVAFAAVSGYLGWQGVASCGCFGAIPASPWWAFGVDVGALALLAVGRPRADVRSASQSGWPAMLGVAGVLLVGLTGYGTARYGSPAAAIARLRGDVLLAEPDVLVLGATAPGRMLDGVVHISNLSDRPVRLVGGTSDCSCIATDSLPLTIPAGDTVAVPITLRVPATAAGTFTRTAELRTDHDRQRTIRLRLSGRAEQPDGSRPSGG